MYLSISDHIPPYPAISRRILPYPARLRRRAARHLSALRPQSAIKQKRNLDVLCSKRGLSLKKAHELTRELTHAPANTCRPQRAHVPSPAHLKCPTRRATPGARRSQPRTSAGRRWTAPSRPALPVGCAAARNPPRCRQSTCTGRTGRAARARCALHLDRLAPARLQLLGGGVVGMHMLPVREEL